MKTLQLTAKDFKQSESYWKDYIGSEDLSDFQGNIEIEENLGYVNFAKIKVSGFIFAKAGTGIKAGEGIEAGWGIKAGEGIEAGSGIEAGLSITCKLLLSFKYKLFAGICYWRDVTDDEKTVTCGKLDGHVEYGIVKEVGMPDEAIAKEVNLSGKKISKEVDGKKYSATID